MSETVRIACANGNCGTFPMDAQLHQKLQRTGESFHCPEGHSQYFGGSTEKQLKDRIEELENKVERYKKKAKARKDNAVGLWEDYQEQKKRRKFAESRLLDYAKGVVEVGNNKFRWSCECESRGQKTFSDVEDAKDAFERHRRRRCSLDEPSEVTIDAEQ